MLSKSVIPMNTLYRQRQTSLFFQPDQTVRVENSGERMARADDVDGVYVQ